MLSRVMSRDFALEQVGVVDPGYLLVLGYQSVPGPMCNVYNTSVRRDSSIYIPILLQ
jgi:hypothetical protein